MVHSTIESAFSEQKWAEQLKGAALFCASQSAAEALYPRRSERSLEWLTIRRGLYKVRRPPLYTRSQSYCHSRHELPVGHESIDLVVDGALWALCKQILYQPHQPVSPLMNNMGCCLTNIELIKLNKSLLFCNKWRGFIVLLQMSLYFHSYVSELLGYFTDLVFTVLLLLFF